MLMGIFEYIYLDLCLASGVHNAKAEECTTPRIGSRNIEIQLISLAFERACAYACA